MSLVRPELVKWCQALGEDLTERGPFTLLKLFHGNDSGGSTFLELWVVKEGTLSHVEFAQEVWDVAEREARTCDAPHQRFVVFAFRGDPEENQERMDYEKRFPFVMVGGQAAEDNPMGGNTNSPTEGGLLAQLMRHNAEQHRANTVLTVGTIERQNHDLSRYRSLLEQMEERHYRTITLQEDLLDRKSERELRHSIELHKAKRLDQATGMVMTFFPLILSGLSGGKNVPGSQIATTARDLAVGNFLKNLSQEEGMKLFHSLSPENQVLFAEFYKSYRNDHEAENAAKPEVLRDQEQTH